MKTNYLSAPVTALNASPVAIAARGSRCPAISQKETKRTKARGVGFAFLLAAFLGSCVTTELRAQVVVVPNALATNDGNVSLTAPTGGPFSLREMRIYDADQFGVLSGPSFLTQFAWRPDTTPGPSGPRSLALRIFASTTSRISNLTYQVQYRSDLTTNLWTSLVDCIRSTNSTSSVYDPMVVGQPQRFYRVVLTNCVP